MKFADLLNASAQLLNNPQEPIHKHERAVSLIRAMRQEMQYMHSVLQKERFNRKRLDKTADMQAKVIIQQEAEIVELKARLAMLTGEATV